MEWSLTRFTLNQCFLIIAVVILTTLPVCLLLRYAINRCIILLIQHSANRPFKEVENELRLRSYDKVMNIATVYLKSYTPADGQKFSGSNGITPIAANFARRESLAVRPVRHVGKKISETFLNMERKVSKAIDCEDAAKIRAKFNETAKHSIFVKMWHILIHPLFILTALTHMAYFWAAITYMMVIVDYANDKGLAVADSVQLISAFSGGDLIGRLGSGWLMVTTQRIDLVLTSPAFRTTNWSR